MLCAWYAFPQASDRRRGDGRHWRRQDVLGRLAAWLAGIPVICSASPLTGPGPCRVVQLIATLLTDAFIGVAESHGRHLTEREGCPANRVRVIPNGVDVDRFRPCPPDPKLREELGFQRRTGGGDRGSITSREES